MEVLCLLWRRGGTLRPGHGLLKLLSHIQRLVRQTDRQHPHILHTKSHTAREKMHKHPTNLHGFPLVRQLHREFLRAGANVMQTFTFYASDDKLENRGQTLKLTVSI